jgi:hypothetical protein
MALSHLLILRLTPSFSVAELSMQALWMTCWSALLRSVMNHSRSCLGDSWSWFSRKSIVVRPTRQRPSQIALFFRLTHQNTAVLPRSHVIWLGSKRSCFLLSMSVSICLKISSNLATSEMVSEKLQHWVQFCLNSRSSACILIFGICWRVCQFLKWVFHARMHFGLVISGFWNQRFRKFHQESVESWWWCPHFHFWGMHPGLKSLPNDQPVLSPRFVSKFCSESSQLYVCSVDPCDASAKGKRWPGSRLAASQSK